MTKSESAMGAGPNGQFLSLMLELDELQHDRRARLQVSLAFVWMLLGFFLGGSLVMIWAG